MNEPNRPQKPEAQTRRSFLKSTSTAVIGGAVLGGLAINRAAHAAGNDTLKVALIGCGGRGTGAASQVLRTGPGVKLVAMADAFGHRLQSSLANLTEQHGELVDVPPERQFVGLNAYQQAIGLADVVVLAEPPGFRPRSFEAAVQSGKHVFMEKPVAVDAPGVRRVLAAAAEAKAKGLKVGVGLQRHHAPGYIETIQRLQGGAIGDIVSMRCYWNSNGVWVRDRQPGQTEMQYQVHNWYYFNWLSGDHIVEQHIHNIDVINWVKRGHPVRCQGMGGRQVRNGADTGHIFDHHFVEFEYDDGSRLYSQCRHIANCWSSVSESVQGTKGSCNISSHTIHGDNAWRFSSEQKTNPYQQEINDLFEAIRQDKPHNEAEYGAMSTMTAIMGRMATYTGQMVEWDEALNSQVDLSPKVYDWDAEAPVLPGPDGFYPAPVPGVTKDI